MLRIFSCTFIVFLALVWPISSASARQEASTSLERAIQNSQSTPSTPPSDAGTPEVQALSIISPLAGQALQGKVPIVARITFEGFVSYELSFAYLNNPTGVWFLIHQGNPPITGGALAQWDTSTISDGEYTLRLVIHFGDGSQQTAFVPGVRVRNYTPIETDTPSPGALTETSIYHQRSIETQTPVSMLVAPTLTPFPSNPAEIGQQDIFDGLLKGALFVLGLFAIGMLYQLVRSFLKKRFNL